VTNSPIGGVEPASATPSGAELPVTVLTLGRTALRARVNLVTLCR
jgi:hypothetical protein